MAELVQEVEERNSIFLAQVCLTHAPPRFCWRRGRCLWCRVAGWKAGESEISSGFCDHGDSGVFFFFFCDCVSLLIVPGPLTTAPLRA